MEYQSVPVPGDLIETINKTDSSGNNIQINHFDSNQPVNQNYHSDNNNDDSPTSSNAKGNSDDGSCGELDSSQQLSGLKLKKVVDHMVQNIMTTESSNSMSVSLTRLTKIGTFIPSLFLQCLYEMQGLS